MSEYYLADQRAQERVAQRTDENDKPASQRGQNLKITLLGDFASPSGEGRGFDPYNSVHGKAPRDTWQTARNRR